MAKDKDDKDETAEKPKTVTMKAVQAHSYHGQDYEVGDTYEADEGDVATIQVQGKGFPADPKPPAKTKETKK
jgi:hypothetical protein